MLTLDMGNRLRTGRWLLMAMLGVLHAALLLDMRSMWVHPLLLAHLGLFLLWQPLWRGESEVGRGPLVFIMLSAAMAMFWLSWWVIAFWVTGLFGLVGARAFAFRTRWARLLNLAVIVYLLAVLLLWVVPHLFDVQSTIEVGQLLMRYVLPVLLLLILAVPGRNEPVEGTQTIDFIYGLLLFMLLTLVVLGSLAFMTLARLDYLEAMMHPVSDRADPDHIRRTVESTLWLQRLASVVFALSAECRYSV